MYGMVFDLQRTPALRPRPAWPRRVRALAVAVAALTLFGFGFAKVAQGSAPSRYETVTVQPGDTLWGIAAGRYPDQDVRVKVGQIEDANGLSSPAIQPGQRLRVPST